MKIRGVEQIPWLYDAICHVAERRGLDRWRDALVAETRGRVLELGCGTGRNLARYPTPPAAAVDPNPQALARARQRAPAVPLLCARAEALPFADASFDCVVSSLVFCSVADVAAGLAEIRRVLAPGGRLLMLEHVRSETAFAARVQDAIQPVWTWAAGGCHPNRDTEQAVREAGFQVERLRARDNWRLLRATAS